MKKVYLSFMCLATISVATAQSSMSVLPKSVKKDKLVESTSTTKKTQSVEKSTPFWTNTFGTPSDWAMANNEANGSAGASNNWTIGTSGGAGTYALAALTSTTASDGFALFDSDNYCSGSQSGYIKTVAPIDCSTHPSVVVTFEQYFRKFNDNACFVGVSTDGTNWTDIQVNGTLAGNIATPNDLHSSVNITAQAAGHATVYIRFLYLSQGGLPSHGCDYNWMVDDVALAEADNYDLSLDKVIWGSNGAFGTLNYYQVPVTEIQPIVFCGVVENLGLLSQTDVVFHADVTTPAYAGATAASTVLTTAIDTICVANPLTPGTSLATTTVAFSVGSGSTDAVMFNNTQPSVDIAVTNGIYARDAGTQTSTFYNSGSGYEVGNVFDIFVDEMLYNIDITLDNTAVVGSIVRGKLYSIDPGTGAFTQMELTDDHVIVAGDQGAQISLELQSPAALTAGSSYLVVAGTDGGTTPDVVVATAGTSEPQTSFFYDLSGTPTWYYVTGTPMVRMNFNNTSGVKELTNTFGVNIYPNPANNVANVSFKLNNESIVSVTVTDLTGKSVYTNNLGKLASGAHATTVNTDALSNGIYMVNLESNGVVSTQKLVIRK